MPREKLQELRSRTLDQISYVLAYAPNFPEEDRTSLQRERERLTSMFAELGSKLRNQDQLTWHRLAEQELTAAFEAFQSGDHVKGAAEIQRAEGHLKRSFRANEIRPNFISGPGGETSQA